MTASAERRTTRAEACVSWIQDHLDLFTIARGITPDADAIALMKPISELALVAAVLARVTTRSRRLRSLRRFATTAGEHAWTQLERGALMVSFLERFPELVILASTYRSFRAMGFENRRFERLLRDTLRLRATAALEFPPWRALDLATAAVALHLPPPFPVSATYQRTWLAARPEPWSLTPSAAYSLTHTVFYMTDFGRAPLALPSRHRAYLHQWTPAWQLFYFNVGDMDLLAEMTMVRRCLGERGDAVDLVGAFDAHRVRGGAIRGPMDLEPGRVSGADARAATFTRDYHTTLVGLLALAM